MLGGCMGHAGGWEAMGHRLRHQDHCVCVHVCVDMGHARGAGGAGKGREIPRKSWLLGGRGQHRLSGVWKGCDREEGGQREARLGGGERGWGRCPRVRRAASRNHARSQLRELPRERTGSVNATRDSLTAESWCRVRVKGKRQPALGASARCLSHGSKRGNGAQAALSGLVGGLARALWKAQGPGLKESGWQERWRAVWPAGQRCASARAVSARTCCRTMMPPRVLSAERRIFLCPTVTLSSRRSSSESCSSALPSTSSSRKRFLYCSTWHGGRGVQRQFRQADR